MKELLENKLKTNKKKTKQFATFDSDKRESVIFVHIYSYFFIFI